MSHMRPVLTCLLVLFALTAAPALWSLGRAETQKPVVPPAQRMFGVEPARVVAVDDPEALGRIKVTFPWLAENREADAWARVSLPIGGGSTGFWALPEVDDEVLVAFESGDLNRPVVIGSLWNGSDRPPDGRRSDSLTSADGRFSVRVTDSGIFLTGPAAAVRVTDTELQVDTINTRVRSQGRTDIDSGLTTDVGAGAAIQLNGAVIRLNGGNCAPAARVGDRVAGDESGAVIVTGSATVTIC